jgi:predicted transcriptional regulator
MIRLSKLEEEILNKLWELERAFPKVLISHLSDPKPPYNTILSVIRKLEKEGHIGFKKYGKSHEYFPITNRADYGKSLFKKLYHDVLQGSNSSLLSYFLKEENVDLEELQELIDQLKAKEDGSKLSD